MPDPPDARSTLTRQHQGLFFKEQAHATLNKPKSSRKGAKKDGWVIGKNFPKFDIRRQEVASRKRRVVVSPRWASKDTFTSKSII
jgi:hypothetical protein